MSAFIVESSCVDRAVSLWMTDSHGQSPNHGAHFSCEDADELGRKMMRLNVRAVDHRYRTNEGADWETYIDGYAYPLKYVPRIEALKALQCVIYQCSEGDEFTSTDTYKEMRRMERLALQHIVDQLPEYQKAPWG